MGGIGCKGTDGGIGCKGCASESCAPKNEDGARLISAFSAEAESELDKAFMNAKEQFTPPVEASTDMLGAPFPEETPRTAKRLKAGEEYVITLDKMPGSMLGLDVDAMTEAQALPIRAITGGLAEEWNEQNPDAQIVIGDKIVAVNGERADSSTMMTKCARENPLKLVLKRSFAGVHDAECIQRVE